MTRGGTIFKYFASVEDPRMDRNKIHPLMDIISISICAIICGADSWTDIEAFGNCKLEWLRTFLELPNGIPSHDTFQRVFTLMNPKQFEQSFQAWMQAIVQLVDGDVVAIDGKTVRRSHNRLDGIAPLHLVSAFAAKNGLTLGQRAIDTKSNELKAIPKLLEQLVITGSTVTIDAAGCYPEVVDSIVEQKAKYVIAVKQNQPTLYQDIEALFAEQPVVRSMQTKDTNHGRTELRECWVITAEEQLQKIHHKERWQQLNSVAKITSTRTVNEKTSSDTRYYISSLVSGNAKDMLSTIRQHWMIENSLHWILDIAFREDESRIRTEYAQENFALMRKIALNLCKQEKTVKIGVKGKRLLAGWDEHYLLKLLNI